MPRFLILMVGPSPWHTEVIRSGRSWAERSLQRTRWRTLSDCDTGGHARWDENALKPEMQLRQTVRVTAPRRLVGDAGL